MNSHSARPQALVTGASVGIGRALALELARDGYDLFLVSRDGAALEAVAQACRAAGAEARALACDLFSADSAEKVRAWVHAAGRPLEVLVNNAGFGLHGDFAVTDVEQELKMVQLQLTTLLRLTKVFLPEMIRQGKGRLLNVSSVYAFAGVPHQTVYGACKAFLFNFSQGLAEEVRGTGVTVTVLCPGSTRTEFRKRAGIAEKKKTSGMTAEAVAAQGYRGMVRGQLLVVPGGWNALFVFFARRLPVKWVGVLIRKINQVRLHSQS